MVRHYRRPTYYWPALEFKKFALFAHRLSIGNEGLTITDSAREKLIERWRKEEQQPFAGWDFSYLNDRMVTEQPPWAYMERAAELMTRSSSVLDLGTGGGERLLKLRGHWPETVVVTEEYPPNLTLVRKRLTSLGVRVVDVPLSDTHPLPFDDGEFDLVINRHSAFNPAEIARVLAPGGRFLTQQVGPSWAHDLLAAFAAPTTGGDKEKIAWYRERLARAGMTIDRQELWRGTMTFYDVGAIVYYLTAIPWLVPGFSVDTHSDSLLKLQERMERNRVLSFEISSYLIEARRTGLGKVRNRQ